MAQTGVVVAARLRWGTSHRSSCGHPDGLWLGLEAPAQFGCDLGVQNLLQPGHNVAIRAASVGDRNDD